MKQHSKRFEVVRLPFKGAKERHDFRFTVLTIIITRTVREAKARFVRENSFLATNEQWVIR